MEIEPPAAAGEGRAVRTRLGLGDVGDAFVLGWVGSFRPFHALHRLVEVAAGLEGVTLLLVGDGPERPAVEARARELGVRAVFTGTVPHLDLPRYLAAMDAAAVIAPDHGEFHYSPLKLAEYLAAGLPVVAPDVETVSSRLVHEEHALLVLPADRSALRAAIVRLRDDAGGSWRASRAPSPGRDRARRGSAPGAEDQRTMQTVAGPPPTALMSRSRPGATTVTIGP